MVRTAERWVFCIDFCCSSLFLVLFTFASYVCSAGASVTQYGNAAAFTRLLAFAASNDMRVPSNYASLAQQVNLPSFVDFLLVQFWAGTTQWPVTLWAAFMRDGVPLQV